MDVPSEGASIAALDGAKGDSSADEFSRRYLGHSWAAAAPELAYVWPQRDERRQFTWLLLPSGARSGGRTWLKFPPEGRPPGGRSSRCSVPSWGQPFTPTMAAIASNHRFEAIAALVGARGDPRAGSSGRPS